MKKDNVIQNKTFDFAVRIIKLYQYLSQIKKEYVLSKQVLRSGTSIGANVEEAIGGQSKKDFAAKLSISYKEARETLYWIKLLYKTEYINKEEFLSLEKDIIEIIKIVTKIKNTLKKNY